MKGRLPTLVMLSSISIFCSCASNHIQFKQRKNFHERVRIDNKNTPLILSTHIHKKENETPLTGEKQVLVGNDQGKTEIKPVNTNSYKKISRVTLQEKNRQHYKFENRQLFKINKIEKVQDDSSGWIAVMIGAIAFLFLMTGFAIFPVSLSFFWTFWVTGFKLAMSAAVYGIVAVCDDDSLGAILGVIIGCLVLILAFALILLLLL